MAGSVVSKPWSLWVFELKPDGDIVWQKSYVHKEAAFIESPNIQRTAAGGIVLAANISGGPFEDTDLLVLKLNSLGGIIWQKAYGDATINGEPVIMQQSSDGGYIFASRYWHEDLGLSLIKIDSQGNIAWQKIYMLETGSVLGVISLLETSDGGFVALANVVPPGPVNMLLFKFDDLGVVQWQRRLGRNWGSDFAPYHEGSSQKGHSIQILEGGDLVIAGETDLFGTGDNVDIILLRLDSQGKIQDCCIEEPYADPEVSPTYFATADTDITSSDMNINVVDTNALVVTPPFTPNYICCGEEDLNIKQGNTNIPSGGVYDFGFIQLGESKTVTFLFENNNSEELGVGLVQIDPAEAFSISTDIYSFFVPPNDSKSFEIEFAPSSGGVFEAEIIFPNSDCDENPYSFTLIGAQPSVLLPVVLNQAMASR